MSVEIERNWREFLLNNYQRGTNMIYECQYTKIDSRATGAKIASLMDLYGISVKELSNTLGVSNQSVYKWLNGQSLPTLENLFQISRILKVSMDEIVIAANTYSYVLPEVYVREVPEITIV